MKDYSKSKFENATAEEAYTIVLDGMAEESIYDGEMVAYDLVTLDGGRRVILRYDSQGFIWVEREAEFRGDPNLMPHWRMLEAEYATEDETDPFVDETTCEYENCHIVGRHTH